MTAAAPAGYLDIEPLARASRSPALTERDRHAARSLLERWSHTEGELTARQRALAAVLARKAGFAPAAPRRSGYVPQQAPEGRWWTVDPRWDFRDAGPAEHFGQFDMHRIGETFRERPVQTALDFGGLGALGGGGRRGDRRGHRARRRASSRAHGAARNPAAGGPRPRDCGPWRDPKASPQVALGQHPGRVDGRRYGSFAMTEEQSATVSHAERGTLAARDEWTAL